MLLFVFWYCHKRGREVRLENERLAAEAADSARASSASSINEDADSIFGDKAKTASQPAEKTIEAEKETPKSPLIIADGKESAETQAAVADLPSVSHLPEPKGQVPETAPAPAPAPEPVSK